MATAIPQSMTFEMLSRLPPNSFVMEWQEVRPSAAKPSSNGWDLNPVGGGSSQRVSFNLRGAPNEFILNTHMHLSGSAWTSLEQSEDNNDAAKRITDPDKVNLLKAIASGVTDSREAITADTVLKYTQSPFGGLGSPYLFFNGSRESFNSGALPYLDNQDSERSKDINTFRLCCASRASGGNSKDSLDTCCAPWSFPLPSAGRQAAYNWLKSVGVLAGVNADNEYRYYRGKNHNFQIPLGLYSSLINCHSVIPIGLFSAYSVDGYRIDLQTNNQESKNDASRKFTMNGIQFPSQDAWIGQKFWMPANNSAYNIAGAPAAGAEAAPLTFSFGADKAWMDDLVIRYPIVRVLDPAVMEAVLSLYEKREQVNLGGVQFPLSLRLNSLGYRFYSQGISTDRSDYYFRIPTTDRSVRAVGWFVQNQQARQLGLMGSRSPLALVRLATRVGTEIIHPVVEDLGPNSENVNNFLASNIKRSASLFSPFPQYQEGIHHGNDGYDAVCRNNNQKAVGSFIADAPVFEGASNGTIVSQTYDSYGAGTQLGIVSFENLDRREGDHQGSYQASGKDMTNVGSIEIDMRFGTWSPQTQGTRVLDQDALNGTSSFGSPSLAYDITFVVAYDNVMEVSPQGVRDISNAVL